MINLLGNIQNKPSKFRRRNWVERNGESRETYNVSNQITFETLMIRSNLCDYSDACMHVKGTITVQNTRKTAVPNSRNKKLIFEHCGPFTYYISEINNTRVDDAHDIDVVMPMYNFIEYRNIYSKTSGSL